jgi:oligopeptide transport system permease protein
MALSLALLLGITAGVIAALRPNSALDYTASGISMLGICLPTFRARAVCSFCCVRAESAVGSAPQVGLIPPTAFYPPSRWASPTPPTSRGSHAAACWKFSRRTTSVRRGRKERVRRASSFRHALRGGLLPVVSYLGPAAAGILTGSFVIETIFPDSRIGPPFRDLGVQSRFHHGHRHRRFFMRALIVFFNLLVDIVQIWLNPKLKY